MTEGNDDGNNLVRVRAQVMMRDDSTGGWVPMGGGGLSNVSVCKRTVQSDVENSKHEYFIYGKRISDQTVVLSCTIKKDFEYNKVMPTFHHWRTGDHKFGLTFQTAADARAFDKGVRLAVDDLLDGLHEIPSYWYHQRTDAGEEDIFIAVTLPADRDGSLSSSGSATTYSNSSRHTPTTTPLPTPDHLHHHTTTANTPLTTPDLPLHHFHHHHHLHHHHHHVSHTGGASTPLGAATTNTSPASTLSHPGTITSLSPNQPFNYHSHSNHHHFHRVSYLSKLKPVGPQSNEKTSPGDIEKGEQEKMAVGLGEPYSYVQLAKTHPPPLHDYSYPMVDSPNKGDRRDSIASIKKQQQLELVGVTPTQPSTFQSGKRGRKQNRRGNRKLTKARCRHCNETFSEDFNSRGSCEYSPDYVRSAIDKLACISCAQCMLYHCMSNAEGEFPHHPCECEGPNDESCGRRWAGLTLLSLLVPCLWCYLPLRACHRCAVSCRLCGGRHEAS